MRQKFVVIIPSRNAANLRPCLQALRQHEPGVPVLVVDDGLDTSTLPWEEFDPPVFVTRGDKPFIFARNINLGIRKAIEMAAAMDFVVPGQPGLPVDGYLLLNDDALLRGSDDAPGGFTLLAEACAAYPEYGLIAATTNVTGQPEQGRRAPSDPDYGLREVKENIPFIAVYIPHRTISLLAHNGLTPVREGDLAPGMLDERYCLDYGCEDNDYNEAVRRAGLKTGVHDGCYVDHGSLKSSFRHDPDTPKTYAQNYELFLAKCKHCDETGESFVAGAGLPQEIASGAEALGTTS